MRESKTNAPDHFDDLVINATDFLTRSVEHLLRGELKYSTIFFYQAAELFVKARLLREHWALILTDPPKADRQSFARGDFKSVTINQAADRLTKIVGEDISMLVARMEPIRVRRNRAIHFHAEDTPAMPKTPPPGNGSSDIYQDAPKEVISIAKEQCLAWQELYELICGKWDAYFGDMNDSVFKSNQKITLIRPFLEVYFDEAKSELAAAREEGKSITACPVCGFESVVDPGTPGGVCEITCLTCGYMKRRLDFPCLVDGCRGSMSIEDGGPAVCDMCEDTMAIEDAADLLDSCGLDGYCVAAHGIFCRDCESQEIPGGTVIYMDSISEYVCLSCLSVYDTVNQCEWCAQFTTEDTDGSYAFGCANCDGKLGHDS